MAVVVVNPEKGNTKGGFNMNNFFKQTWTRFKKSDVIGKVAVKAGRLAGKTYHLVKGAIQKYWKDAAYVTVSTLAAGAVTTGATSAIGIGGIFYLGIKTIEYLTRYFVKGEEVDIDKEFFKDILVGTLGAAAFTAFLLLVAPVLLVTVLEGVKFLAWAWAYAIYLVVL